MMVEAYYQLCFAFYGKVIGALESWNEKLRWAQGWNVVIAVLYLFGWRIVSCADEQTPNFSSS